MNGGFFSRITGYSQTQSFDDLLTDNFARMGRVLHSHGLFLLPVVSFAEPMIILKVHFADGIALKPER
jgi:hypothetical protein